LTGPESRVAEIRRVSFPKLLDPVDDLPPASVITHVIPNGPGSLIVRGTCSDNGTVANVTVNGQAAKATRPNFAEWEATLTGLRGDVAIRSLAEDQAGNVERTAHVLNYMLK
jgi:hypothetical protein